MLPEEFDGGADLGLGERLEQVRLDRVDHTVRHRLADQLQRRAKHVDPVGARAVANLVGKLQLPQQGITVWMRPGPVDRAGPIAGQPVMHTSRGRRRGL